MPSPLTRDAVRSYRTVSPLPPSACASGLAVCFLLHFPSHRCAWSLTSLLPVGVRTFLGTLRQAQGTAILRSAPRIEDNRYNSGKLRR